MSIKLMNMVFDRYPVGGGEMLVALKLADYADDSGEHIFPSVQTIAEKTRQSARAVQYQIRRMQKSGWLSLVANAGGGRGRAREYRISPDWINGAFIAPIQECEKDADIAPIEKGANEDTKGATDDRKGANGDAKGCKAFAPDSPGTTIEPSENHQGARRAPRVALHAELLNLELPDWLPFELWDMWCEHREAKAKGKAAPWTRPAARVALKRLESLRAIGHSPQAVIEEAVLRGWTGLFEVKAAPASGSAQTDGDDWWLSRDGTLARGRDFGMAPRDGEIFLRFKARVVKRAGPGPWMEDMLARTAKESETTYEQLLAFFNDVRLPKTDERQAA